MRRISRREVALDDGSKVVALEEPNPPGTSPDHNFSNNIYRITADGSVLWQIDAGEGVRGRSPFTGIEIHEGDQLVGFRWDGGLYAINIDTGKARYIDFAK